MRLPARRFAPAAALLCGMLPYAAQAQSVHSESVHTAALDITHGRPFVSVMLNGKGPFRFIVDTGTGGEAFVTSEVATQLGLPQVGEARLSDPSGQGGQRAPMVAIQTLNVAGVEFTGVRAVVHALSDGDGSAQGLLGFPLFRDYLLTLDFPGHKLTLEEGALVPDGEQAVLPLRIVDGVPVATIRVGHLRVEAQIDSGGAGLSLPQAAAARVKFAATPAAYSNGESLSTRFEIRAAHVAEDIHLGGYTFSRPFVEINPAFPLANFGSCPMQDFAVTFDQKQKLVRFEARRSLLHLAATPSAIRLVNAPPQHPRDVTLVPVG